MEQVGVSVTFGIQAKDIKPKNGGGGCKVKCGLYCQVVLKQKGVKQVGHKTSATCTRVLKNVFFPDNMCRGTVRTS